MYRVHGIRAIREPTRVGAKGEYSRRSSEWMGVQVFGAELGVVTGRSARSCSEWDLQLITVRG